MDAEDSVRVDYDADVDIRYVSVQDSRASTHVDLDDGVCVRVVRETNEVVGFEMSDCAERLGQPSSAITRTLAKSVLAQCRVRLTMLLECDLGAPKIGR
jgi:uncharacterized protein YuzE